MTGFEVSIRMVLASASPRRYDLLSSMGVSCQVEAADVDETRFPGEPPTSLARRLSLAKAERVVAAHREATVIAADTLVVLDGQILGKPDNEGVAVEMLSRLRNRRHLVYTGLAVINAGYGRCWQQVVATPVVMRDYSDLEIRRYVASGDPLDKAGAYAIQYRDFAPVARFEGCYTNVMGLPLCHLYAVLSVWDIPVPIHPLESCPYALKSTCTWSRAILGARFCSSTSACGMGNNLT